MSWKRATAIIAASVAVGLIGWDIVVAAGAPLGATISEVIRDFSWNQPVIPLAWGVLFSHFFWNGSTPVPKPHRYIVLGLFAAVAILLGCLHWSVFPLWPALVGVPVGRLFWPQDKKTKP